MSNEVDTVIEESSELDNSEVLNTKTTNSDNDIGEFFVHRTAAADKPRQEDKLNPVEEDYSQSELNDLSVSEISEDTSTIDHHSVIIEEDVIDIIDESLETDAETDGDIWEQTEEVDEEVEEEEERKDDVSDEVSSHPNRLVAPTATVSEFDEFVSPMRRFEGSVNEEQFPDDTDDQSDFIPVPSRQESLLWDSDLPQYSEAEPDNPRIVEQSGSQHSVENSSESNTTGTDTLVGSDDRKLPPLDEELFRQAEMSCRQAYLSTFQNDENTEYSHVVEDWDETESNPVFDELPNQEESRTNSSSEKYLSPNSQNETSLKISISTEVLDCTIQADNLPIRFGTGEDKSSTESQEHRNSKSSSNENSPKLNSKTNRRVPQTGRRREPGGETGSSDFSLSETNNLFKKRPPQTTNRPHGLSEQMFVQNFSKVGSSHKNIAFNDSRHGGYSSSSSRDRSHKNSAIASHIPPMIPDLQALGVATSSSRGGSSHRRKTESVSSSESGSKPVSRGHSAPRYHAFDSCGDHSHHNHNEVHKCCLPPPPTWNFTPRIEQVKREVTRRSISVDEAKIARKQRSRIPSSSDSTRHNTTARQRTRRLSYSGADTSDNESVASSRIPRYVGQGGRTKRDSSLTDDEQIRSVSRSSFTDSRSNFNGDNSPNQARSKSNHEKARKYLSENSGITRHSVTGKKENTLMNHWAVGFLIGLLAAAAFRYLLYPGTNAAFEYMQKPKLEEEDWEPPESTI